MVFPEQLNGLKVCFDGQLIAAEDSVVHLMTHGLHYATAAFEGIRIYNRTPFLLREHMERLHHSCNVLMMEVPYSVEQLCAQAQQVVDVNQIDFGYIRPLVWRGSEGMLIAGHGTKVHCAIAAWGVYESGRAEIRQRGANLGYSAHPKLHPSHTFWSTKATCIYALCYVIKREANANGYDDMVALDLDGYLTEVSSANLIFIKDGALVAPIPDCFLNGLTRQTVLKLAHQMGIAVHEVKVTKEMAAEADAAFLTGTALELLPIKKLAETEYEVEHPIFLQLEKAFHQLVNS